MFLVPNAANTAARRRGAGGRGTGRSDRRRTSIATTACSPCRDRESVDVLTGLGLPTDIDYMAFADADWRAFRCACAAVATPASAGTNFCRAGTTAEPVFRALASVGPRRRWAGGRPRRARHAADRDGLSAARARVFARHLARSRHACGWAVGWKKPQFWGREALLAEKECRTGTAPVGSRALDRGVLRAGLTVSL